MNSAAKRRRFGTAAAAVELPGPRADVRSEPGRGLLRLERDALATWFCAAAVGSYGDAQLAGDVGQELGGEVVDAEA
jgi:hypothetical protein